MQAKQPDQPVIKAVIIMSIMKNISLLAAFIFFSLYAGAQLTQAEIEQKMKAAQAEIDKMKNDPRMKEYVKNMPNLDTAAKKMKEAGNTIDPAKEKTILSKPAQLPEKNTKLLQSLPKKPMGKKELSVYLETLNSQLSQKIKSPAAADAKLVSAQPGTTG